MSITLRKRLQVFISSTYKDLIPERQAAVQAVLATGHIPAGMELFAAGDETQMQVIKHWIEESDVFLLILGGRYGSIEPKSGKSYIELEYDYAVVRGMPLFSVVVDEAVAKNRVRTHELGAHVLELRHQQEWQNFYNRVTGKMVKFWKDVRDIELAVHQTMGELNRRNDLVGWIRGDQTDTQSLKAGIDDLRNYISQINAKQTEIDDAYAVAATEDPREYGGLTFGEAVGALTQLGIHEEVAELPLHPFPFDLRPPLYNHDDLLLSLGLILRHLEPQASGLPSPTGQFVVTDLGRRFFLRLKYGKS